MHFFFVARPRQASRASRWSCARAYGGIQGGLSGPRSRETLFSPAGCLGQTTGHIHGALPGARSRHAAPPEAPLGFCSGPGTEPDRGSRCASRLGSPADVPTVPTPVWPGTWARQQRLSRSCCAPRPRQASRASRWSCARGRRGGIQGGLSGPRSREIFFSPAGCLGQTTGHTWRVAWAAAPARSHPRSIFFFQKEKSNL